MEQRSYPAYCEKLKDIHCDSEPMKKLMTLVNEMPDVNACGDDDATLLHRLLWYEPEPEDIAEMVEFLLAKGADPRLRRDGINALQVAATLGSKAFPVLFGCKYASEMKEDGEKEVRNPLHYLIWNIVRYGHK